jgi:hypothetical protein
VHHEKKPPYHTDAYRTDIRKISDLDTTTREGMSDLYLAHYDGSDATLFQQDLTSKTEAILVYHQRSLVGFTLCEIYQTTWQGHPIRIIYSGDTVVERPHWGQQALAFSWIARAGQIKRQASEIPLYWFLIVKGHRTYRYLPTFTYRFHPHWSYQDDKLKALADWVARNKFHDAYDQSSGVIHFDCSHGHLKQAFANPTPRELAKESVQFFLERNPDYLHGDELVCLCELSEVNLKPLARRLFMGITT